MENVLVTGYAGFVGRHIVKRLYQSGCFVVGVDNFSTGLRPDYWPKSLYDFEPPYSSYDGDDLREWMRISHRTQNPFDTIFHCAAVVGGRLKIEGDPLAVATDLSIDAEFFNWAVRLDPKPKKVVYFSSSAVYPTELQSRRLNCHLVESLVDLNSSRIGMPDFSYGWSKLSGEYLAKVAAEKYNLNVVIYRPFSGYGEDQDLTYPFPAIVKRFVERQDPMMIWGSGEQQRDFIHIDDVVDAVFSTMNLMIPGETLNLGTGIGTSFSELAAYVGAATGHRPEMQFCLDKPEGVFSRVADTWKLRTYWQPKITLDEGIRRVVAHLTQQKT